MRLDVRARTLGPLIALCLSTAAASAQPLGSWKFDGDLTDAGGNYDGVFAGGEAPVYTTGADGAESGAVVLDGVDDYIEIADPTSALALSTRFSITLWFKAASTDQSQTYLLARHENPGRQYAIIYEYTDDRVDFFAPARASGDDPRAGGQSEMPLADTDWHHIAYTYDGAMWRGYMDGVLEVEVPITFELDASFVGSWFVGAARPGASLTAGAYDDVRIYGGPLSAADVQVVMDGGEVECPAEGDTTCDGLQLAGPGGLSQPGEWTATASATDDSGDAVLYTFSAEDGSGRSLTVGPTSEPTATLQLGPGTWTVSVTVDDDPVCDDQLEGATCTTEVVVESLAPQLLAHWAFDASLADVVGGYDGTWSGSEAPVYVDGYDGSPAGAVQLDGVDDFVRVADATALRLGSAFTLALRVKSASVDQSQKYLFSRDGSGGQYAIIYEYTDDRVDFYAPTRASGDDPRAGGQSEMPLADTEWHHIAYTYDGSVWAGYVDGVQVFETAIDFVLAPDFAGDWYIGSSKVVSNAFGGALDDVQIYNYGLTSEEVAELAGEVTPCPEVGDTRVTSFEATEPEGGSLGVWELTATAEDDSADPILYTFRAQRGEAAPIVVGPVEDGAGSVELGYGEWTLSVTVDDDPLCADTSKDAVAEIAGIDTYGEPRLVAHWPFDGDTLDAVGSNDGVFSGGEAPVYVDGALGEPGGALQTDGVDDLVTIADAPELRLVDRFTIALWFRSASTEQAERYLIAKNGGGGQYAIIYGYTDDRVDFFAPSRLYGDDPRAGGVSEMPLADTEWHHFAYTYDGASWRGYVDGAVVVEQEIAFALSDIFVSPWYIGGANPSAAFVGGEFDDVRIYNAALTAAEVEELAERGDDGPTFTRGDSDASGVLDITDGVVILQYLFVGGDAPPCLDAADTDDSGVLDISDGIGVLSFLFTGGASPSAPYPECGEDPDGADDGIDCLEPHLLGACAP